MDNSAYYCYCCLLALLPPLYFLVKFWWRTSCARRSHGLRLPPGPWQLPIIGSIHHLRGSLVHRALRDLSLRHGPLMFLRLGEVPVVVASTPDAAKEFMKTHDATFATRPMTLSAKVFAKDGPGIVVAPYGGDHWRQLRKICIVELLSARRVRSFGPVREEEAARLVQAVAGASTRRAPAPAPLVDLGRLAAVYVADASVRAIVGRRFGETDALLRFVDESVSLAGGFTPVDLFPSSLLVRVLTLRRTVRRLEHFRESLFGFMDGVVREHLERKQSSRGGGGGEEEEEADMVDVLLRIQQEGNLKFPLTMRIIEAVIFVSTIIVC
jgi:cytochrome P450